MGADNWQICPNCRAKHETEIQMASDGLTECYGSVPVDEYERRKRALDEMKRGSLEDTLREDYTIHFDTHEMTLTMQYHSHCECGFGFSHEAIIDVPLSDN